MRDFLTVLMKCDLSQISEALKDGVESIKNSFDMKIESSVIYHGIWNEESVLNEFD